MTPKTELETVMGQVRDLCESLDDERINWSPMTGAWSIAQCMDHLTITARKFGAAIDESIARSQQRGWTQRSPLPEPPLWGRLFLRIMEPPVGRFKVRAGEAFQPDAGRPATAILSEFLDAHDNLLRNWERWLQADLIRTRVRGPFPFPFPLVLVMHIIPAHARRHLWQARQVQTASGFPRVAGVEPVPHQ